MKLVLLVSCGAALALAASLSGCGPTAGRADRKDLDDPRLRAAQACEARHDEAGAMAAYEAALDADPKLARAHLALAFLLDRSDRDYVAAVYHYERYLALRPDTEKVAMIRQRALEARLAYSGMTARDVSNVAARAMGLDGDLRRLQEENATLRAQLAERTAGLAGASNAVAEATRATPAPRPSPAGRAYRIKSGDTLRKIADRYYGDPNLWLPLYEANRSVLRSATELQPGTLIVIPPRR